jgi:uncharacterized repeat protein (TIGR01451 family)
VATVTNANDTDNTNNSSSDQTTIDAVADLTIQKSHTGNFTQGQTGTYTITVTNSGAGPTVGAVTVSDSMPAGLTFNSITSATGWNCAASTPSALSCTRSDALASSNSYPVITFTVNVSQTAAASITNTATVSGGGELNTGNNSASDPTTVGQLISVTVQTTPAGLSFTVDGTTYTSAQTFS